MCVRFQIEDIRNSIDKIDENVAEVKKLYSVILSAPTSDQSKNSQHNRLFIGLLCQSSRRLLHVVKSRLTKQRLLAFALICSLETQDELEAMTNDIKKMANNARNKLKSECITCP